MQVMIKNGFVFLALGFTGPKAGKFKEEYINAFTQMEEQLKSITALPNFYNPFKVARGWADAEEKRHTHVMRDIRSIINKGGIDLIVSQKPNLVSLNEEPICIESHYYDAQNKLRSEYLLNWK